MLLTLRGVFAIAVLALPAAAGTLTGVVRNGTTGVPAADQTVVLIRLEGGMEEVAAATTDSAGRYRLEHADIGRRPMLVRANYRGVNYHRNVPPGQSTADVEIFEPTAAPADVKVGSRAVIVQPNGPVLLVGEEYEVVNSSSPPATFSREFEFRIPEGGELAEVSAWGPAGMPVVQGTINKGKNHFAILFPLRPGENGIRLSYQMAYALNRATLGAASPYPAEMVMLIAPPSIGIEGRGFQPSGERQGWNVFARSRVPANEPLEVRVSGAAPPPKDRGTPGQGGATSGSGSEVAQIQVMPARLDSLKWVLIAGFGAIFALGALYLWRRPQAAAVEQARAQIDREVREGLDEIKEALFRLELRRQAGTISETDYAAERSRAEKTLRDLVRG